MEIEPRGCSVEKLATVDLSDEIDGLAGTVHVLEGTITDHRDGLAIDYGPGLGWPEDRHTPHWLENRGTSTAVEVSVDIVRRG